MINPPTGLYAQLSSNYKVKYLDLNKLTEYVDAYMWCDPFKEVQQEDKLLKNIDICLELIEKYERRIS